MELKCFSYACSSQSDELKKRVKYSNNILLPPSILYDLNEKKNNFDETLFFKIINKEIKLEQVCGVQEFTACPGTVNLPFHIMEELGLQEADEVYIELAKPVSGTYIKIRPHKTEFINLHNPKAILEKVLSKNYKVLNKGSTIPIYYKELNKVYRVDIVETKPDEVIKIIDIDLNVDFDEPLDYVPPEKPVKLNNFFNSKKDNKGENTVKLNNFLKKEDKTKHDINKFPGKGNRLGGK